MNIKTTTLIVGALLTAMTLSAPLHASDTGEIKYRQAVMKSIGGHMGAIAGMIKGETANTANLKIHTSGMAGLATATSSIFPNGSDMGETEALPAFWEKADDFAKAVKMFQDAAANLDDVATTGDMAKVGPAFGALGKSCKNCHENFREKKQ